MTTIWDWDRDTQWSTISSTDCSSTTSTSSYVVSYGSRGTTRETCSVQTCRSGPAPQQPQPGDEGYKQPNIHALLRDMPKHLSKSPRIEIALMSKVCDRHRSMKAFFKRPLPIRDNKKKHKEFFNRNAVVHTFCQN